MKQFYRRKFILLSYLEGAGYALMVATSESFALYFGLKQGLAPAQLGIVTTTPLLLGAFFQWMIPSFVRDRHLARSVLFAFVVQLCGLALLFKNVTGGNPFWGLLLALTLYWIGGMVAGPLWLDWMGTRLRATDFGSFISKRNAFVTFSTLIFYLSAGYSLHHFSFVHPVHLLFFGFIGRLISLLFQIFVSRTSSTTEPKTQEVERRQEKSSFRLQLSKLLWITIALTALFKFSSALSSPYFLPFMVNELGVTAWEYVLLNATPLLARTLFLQRWAFAATTFRPILGLQVSILLVSFIPTLWTLSQSFTYLLILEFYSGIAWAGFEISCVLFVHHFIRERRRQVFGFHLFAMNFGALLGSIVGAELLKQNFAYDDVFHTSTGFRLLTLGLFVFFLRRFPEERLRLPKLGGYLTTVLTLRPSLAQIGRILIPRYQRIRRNASVKRNKRVP